MPEKIPVVSKDFVFAAISEELGGVFALCLIFVCISCLLMFFNISMSIRDPFYKLIALGLAVEYGTQVFLTIGGVTKFIPSTGVTLPLVSYGGSSLLATMILFAIIQGLYMKRNDEEREIEDEKEMRECTFEPKLNKSISFINNSNYNKTYTSLLNLNLIDRQDAWIEKRNNMLKQKEKEKQEEQMKNCFFTPEINDEDALEKSKIKTKTINLLEDPESYTMYIRRLQKKRDDDEKERRRQMTRPGSGNIWEKRLRSNRSNNSYDYTKHEYSKNISRNKSCINKRFNNSKYSINNNRTLKTESSIGRFSKRFKKEVDKSKLYEEIYKKNISKISDPYGNGNKNEVTNITGMYEHDFIYNQPIEYGKAIDILHNALFSIDLESEQDDI